MSDTRFLTECEQSVSHVGRRQRVQLTGGLENVVRVTFVPFESCSRSEIARPESMRVMRIGKEVVGLRCPSVIGFVQRVQVARRRRVEHIHVAAIHLLEKIGNDEQMQCEEDSRWKNLPRH